MGVRAGGDGGGRARRRGVAFRVAFRVWTAPLRMRHAAAVRPGARYLRAARPPRRAFLQCPCSCVVDSATSLAACITAAEHTRRSPPPVPRPRRLQACAPAPVSGHNAWTARRVTHPTVRPDPLLHWRRFGSGGAAAASAQSYCLALPAPRGPEVKTLPAASSAPTTCCTTCCTCPLAVPCCACCRLCP